MNEIANRWEREVEAGSRFEFGANWAAFLKRLDDDRIRSAEDWLKQMLELDGLEGKTFLDIGSGSGLFSLAARRLGATVTSFDFDPNSVACTAELKRRYFPDDKGWNVSSGSALDAKFMDGLGTFDVVYSWGVLHHTGDMWTAMRHAVNRVAPGGLLYISIYNDQGRSSRIWKRVKQAYVKAPGPLKWAVLLPAFARLWGPSFLRDTMGGHPLRTWRNYGDAGGRGMDAWRDVVDWVGGYPFEVARPEEVLDFVRPTEFELCKMRTWAGGHGCNEFVFRRK